VLELKFSPAGISSFLVAHRKSPREAIDGVEQLISKPPRISEDAKPEIAGASKLVCLKRSVNQTLLTTYLGGMRNLQQRKSQDGSNLLALCTTEQPGSKRRPRDGQSRHGHRDSLWSCPELHLLSYTPGGCFRGDPNRALFASSRSGKPAICTDCDY